MKVVTPQITWHNRDPVLCVDFDPSCFPNAGSKDAEDGSNGAVRRDFYRLATGGSDTHLLIWHLRHWDTTKPDLTCATELTRHTKAVNTVRFSPCGKLLASADDDAYVYIWKYDGEKSAEGGEEFWSVGKALRKHIDDVSDLSWSPDSNLLVTTSVDNSAIIWDVKKGVPLHIWNDLGGFVQGVSFDPLQEYVATVSTDRTLRLFNPRSGKLSLKALKYPSKWLPLEKEMPVRQVSSSAQGDEDEVESVPSKKVVTGTCNRLFHDDSLKSFCRRLSFSPKGEFLVVPGGILPPSRRDESQKSPQTKPGATDSPRTGGKKSRKSSVNKNNLNKEKPLSDKNAVIVFCRNSFSNPCSVIPTGTSYSISVRFCPLYFQRSRELIAYDKSLANPLKKSERLTTCSGKLKEVKKGKKSLLDMPYRLLFAVATNDSLIISDTDSTTPLAVVRNIHLTRMTDLTWSPDGRVLIASSTDGYCSILSFQEGELGTPILEEVGPAPAEAYPIPPTPVKKKPSKFSKKPQSRKILQNEAKEPKSEKAKLGTPLSAKKKENKKTPKKEKEITQFFAPGPRPPKSAATIDASKGTREDTVQPTSVLEEKAANACKEEVALVDLDEEYMQSNVAYEEHEAEKEKIAITPKRNTFLDRWLKKTNAPDASASPAPNPKPKEGMLTAEEQKVPPPLPLNSPLKPIDAGMNFSAPSPALIPPLLSPTCRSIISPDKLRQLQNAPIIVDLEADEAENAASVILSSADIEEKEGKEVLIEKDVFQSPAPPAPKASAPPPVSTPTANTNAREKRPATSPLSSQQKPKQPRRVEFITLPKSPRRD